MKFLGHTTHHLQKMFGATNKVQIKTEIGGRFLSKIYGLSDILGYTFPLSGWWPGSVEPELIEERLRLGFDWTSVQIWSEMSKWITQGKFPYEEQWKKVDVPLLVLLGDEDHLLTPTDGQPAYHRSGSTDKELIILDDFHHETHWGHLDIILGKLAQKHIWTTIDGWLQKRI